MLNPLEVYSEKTDLNVCTIVWFEPNNYINGLKLRYLSIISIHLVGLPRFLRWSAIRDNNIHLGCLICLSMSFAHKLSEFDCVDLHRKPSDEALHRAAYGRPAGRLRTFRSTFSSVEIQPKQQSSSLQSQSKSSAWRRHQRSNWVSVVSTSESLLCHQLDTTATF